MKNSAQGFTLIELLIVIAIIGILAAVLIPNLLSARTRAYDAASNACAREMQMKQEIYQIDFRTYATKAQMTGDFAPKCDAQVTWTVATNSAAAWTGTAKHANSSKTINVSNDSLQ